MMRIGVALPQYDSSVPGKSRITYDTVVEHARRAEAGGVDSLWLSDHLFLDFAKYGGSPDRVGALEPLVTLAALARDVRTVRLGTLVLLEALRPAAVLAKALATLDRICDGRLDVGLGAGWYEPDYEAIGMAFPSPAERLARLREAVEVCVGLIDGGPLTYDGRYHRAVEAINRPPAVQQPRPPVFVGGKGDRLLALAAECADGWNTCWVWTPTAYRERLEVLDRACERIGRDPATVWRSLGLYALVGEDEADLAARFSHLRSVNPGVLGSVSLDEWRVGRLVGTVEQVQEQAQLWAELGVETLILGLGAVPFQVASLDLLDAAAEALRRS